MDRKIIVIILLLFAGCTFFVGYKIGGSRTRAVTPEGEGQNHASQPQAHRTDSRAAGDNNATKSKKKLAHLQQVLESQNQPEKRRYCVPRDLLPAIRVRGLEKDFGVSEQIADILQISEADKTRLDDSFRAARAKLDDLELNKSKVLDSSDEGVTLIIPPFHSEGDQVHNELTKVAHSIFEDEEADFLLKNTLGPRWSTSNRFAYFGQAERRIELTQEDDGSLTVKDNFTQYSQDGVPGNRGSSTGTIPKAEIPAKYAHLFTID